MIVTLTSNCTSKHVLGVIWSEFACEDVDDDRLGQIVVLSKSSTVNDQLWAHTNTITP